MFTFDRADSRSLCRQLRTSPVTVNTMSIKTESSAGSRLSTNAHQQFCPSTSDVGVPAAVLMANVGTLLDSTVSVQTKQKIVGDMINRLQAMRYEFNREIVAQVRLYVESKDVPEVRNHSGAVMTCVREVLVSRNPPAVGDT